MKTKTKSTTTSTAYGKALDTPLPYSFSWDTYESIDEVRAANDLLNDSEQVKARNRERQNNARAKALEAALKAAGFEKPTLENDPQMRLKEMLKVLMSTKKYTEDAARDLASTTLGIAWEDDD